MPILAGALALGATWAVPVARAQGPGPTLIPAAPPPVPPWSGSVGLSYLATSGNTDTQSFGFDATLTRRPTPWGLELRALANRADSRGVRTAERELASLRATRALGERWEWFAGASWERNRFAGFDSRGVIETGGTWKALTGPRHELAFDAGLSWTRKDPVAGSATDHLGGVAGLDYAWQINGAATLRERLLAYPSFDSSDDWRASSETSFEVDFAASWALRASYLYTRDNRPEPGFGPTDASTAVSLVWKR